MRWEDSFVAEATLKDFAPKQDLIVSLPNVEKQNVLVERADDGQVYFAIHDYPTVPGQVQAATPPKHVVIFWDASGSRGGSDHRREIGLLKEYFQYWARTQAWRKPPVTLVDLILVRNAASQPRRFMVSAFNPAELIAALEKLQYDGGTQLGAIAALPGGEKSDFYMLFSDGLSNFGRQQPEKLDAPVYAFSADSTADHSLLRHLAMTTGGQYFNLVRMTNAEAIAAMGQSPYSFLSAMVDGGEAGELFPNLAQPVGRRFTLVGKLGGGQATVTLSYGSAGTVSQSRTFHVARDGAAEGSLLRRLWAQTKLAELMVFQKRNEREIVELGKQYGLVTPLTSLIVLESLEQYVEHEIAPPQSLPQMRAEYMKRIDTIEFQQRKQQADKLATVLRMWEDRVKWYETEFKYPKDFKYRAPEEKTGEAQGGERNDRPAPDGDVPPPPAMEPPAEQAPEPATPDAAAGEDGFLEGEQVAKSGESQDRRAPGISIKEWDPKTPYIEELRGAKRQAAFGVYMENRREYGDSPAFFLDCADHFLKIERRDLALQVLSNIAEMELENPALLRVLGHRLAQLGYLDLAILTFEEVLRLRPEEPQSYRDLALVLALRAQGNTVFAARSRLPAEKARRLYESVTSDYARSLELLAEVVMGHWDGRFTEIELIALEELNAMLPRAQAAGVKEIPLDKRLVKLLDVDVRIVMTWHADDTDIDLWVIEPSGEKAFYAHNRTTIGGLVSQDFTGGYGPEEYMVRKAMPGMYKIQANYYGSRATRLLGAVTVQVDVFTDFGRQQQQRKSITIRLKEAEETVEIGQIEF